MRVKGTESESYLRKLKNKKPEKEVRKLGSRDVPVHAFVFLINYVPGE